MRENVCFDKIFWDKIVSVTDSFWIKSVNFVDSTDGTQYFWKKSFHETYNKSTICLITIFVWTFGWDFNLFISLIFYKWWAIRQYRESSSVQSFLSTSADHRTRSTHLSREKPIVLKKKKRYSMRSGTGLMNSSHVREAVSRQRWSMPKTGKTRWWHILRMDTAVFPITYVRMSYVHLQL